MGASAAAAGGSRCSLSAPVPAVPRDAARCRCRPAAGRAAPPGRTIPAQPAGMALPGELPPLPGPPDITAGERLEVIPGWFVSHEHRPVVGTYIGKTERERKAKMSN